MKAIRVSRFGGPEVLSLEDAPDPKPQAGQCVLRVRAAGVNPVDTYLRAGAYSVKPPLPWTPGMDAAGVVESVGEGVTSLKTGQRVYAAGTLSGAYAERALCAASQLHPLAERLSFAQGAAIGVPYGTAYRALHRGRAKEGDLVLVHGGSGGVGTAALQMCRWLGLRCAATASTEKGRALAQSEGAAAAFDHAAPGYEKALLAWTAGRGFDLVLEMLANVNLARDLTLLAPRGRVVVIGSRGSLEFDPRAAMGKEADILGMSLLNLTPEELAALHEGMAGGLASGALTPVIAAQRPLAEAARAHEDILKPGAHGKIVLTA